MKKQRFDLHWGHRRLKILWTWKCMKHMKMHEACSCPECDKNSIVEREQQHASFFQNQTCQQTFRRVWLLTLSWGLSHPNHESGCLSFVVQTFRSPAVFSITIFLKILSSLACSSNASCYYLALRTALSIPRATTRVTVFERPATYWSWRGP